MKHVSALACIFVRREKCWNECLKNGVTLPIKDIRVEDKHGLLKVIRRSLEEINTTNGNINVGIEEQSVTGNAVSNHINNFKELKKFQHGKT